jgi:hypothetical protein
VRQEISAKAGLASMAVPVLAGTSTGPLVRLEPADFRLSTPAPDGEEFGSCNMKIDI